MDASSSGINFDTLVRFLADVKFHKNVNGAIEKHEVDASKMLTTLQLLKPSLATGERSLKTIFTKTINKLNNPALKKDQIISESEDFSDNEDPVEN